MHRPLLVALAISCSLLMNSKAQPQEHEKTFSAAEVLKWQEREFAAPSSYRLSDNGDYLIASCQPGQASALYLEQALKIDETPYLNWRWRIPKSPPKLAAERSKQGDDFMARIYAVSEQGIFGLATKAVNFVWAAEPAIGSAWPNPFTDQAMMVVQRNSESATATWLTEQVNLAEQFQRHYDLTLDHIDGLALMVDCDNSGGHREFHLERIWFSAQP
ncbi:DUF3047 domain-containing protein [Pseudidiomarina insulisalsae]|uniref:DUF3047 domain-containing protein n=1 Tax=Pseudidiomarina insulisalsae TaxID=575789 RepID=A0A432YPX9_9GAMM|nr:DUF3047 domain-containing protein [Pseudidiomarina insulisalsae]RUO63139.1 hypothetical protein CWI71_02640 [Pseudidiomarina insulisalsae]